MDFWFSVAPLGLGLLALWAYVVFRSSASRSKGTRQSRPGPARLLASPWEARVLAQMRGDRARFRRTLEAKRVKYPRATRDQLLEIIYEEYLRDHR